MAFIYWLLFHDRQNELFQLTAPKRGETDRDYARRLRKMHWRFLGE